MYPLLWRSASNQPHGSRPINTATIKPNDVQAMDKLINTAFIPLIRSFIFFFFSFLITHARPV
jgi:hypothetical protein